MEKECNLDLLLNTLGSVKTNGAINVYAVKNNLARQSEMFSVALPEDINKNALETSCSSLVKFQNASCVNFDPINTKEETYEFLDLKKIEIPWQNIETAINESDGFKDNEAKEKTKSANLLVIDLTYGDERYFLCAIQKPTTQLFKGKTAFFEANDKLEEFSARNLYILNFNIDFIILESNSCVFIFNKKNFINVFKYDEYLKEKVDERIDLVDSWKCFDSLNIIKEYRHQKNVYKNLSKIFDDPDYLEQIQNIEPKTLKKRLLENSNGAFGKEDFSESKLIVTKKNLDKVMKMLGKGFKYNFFNGKAEE